LSLKRDKVCPQCEHRKLWHVEKVRITDGQTLGVTVDGSVWSGYLPLGPISAYVCAACGFTELYTNKLEQLRANPPEGIHFIDNEPKAGLR
jgi:hypothetical protein